MFIIFFKKNCPYSEKSIEYLEKKNKKYKKYILGEDFTNKEFKNKYGINSTYPRIYEEKSVKGVKKKKIILIGGYVELEKYL